MAERSEKRGSVRVQASVESCRLDFEADGSPEEIVEALLDVVCLVKAAVASVWDSSVEAQGDRN